MIEPASDLWLSTHPKSLFLLLRHTHKSESGHLLVMPNGLAPDAQPWGCVWLAPQLWKCDSLSTPWFWPYLPSSTVSGSPWLSPLMPPRTGRGSSWRRQEASLTAIPSDVVRILLVAGYQNRTAFSLTPSPPLPPYVSSFLPLFLFLSLFCCRMLLTRVENMTDDDSSQYLTALDVRYCLFFLIFSTPKILGKDRNFADLCQVLTPRKIMYD